MSYDINVSRDSSDAPESTADFFDEVKNGRDETTSVPGGYGSYPRIYVVTIGDNAFYGFATGLDASRGPWLAGYEDDSADDGAGTWFDRDTVLDAETLEEVEGAAKQTVAHLVNAADNDELDAEDASAATF